MEVSVAEHAGYCYGVERALKLTRRAARDNRRPIYTLGPIIHNPQVVESFREQGVMAVDSINHLSGGTIIVRSHGVEPSVVEEASARGLNVIDATCPFVAKAQRRAASLARQGYTVVIVGERNHPEVIGIRAHAGDNVVVAEKPEDLGPVLGAKKVGVVVQTTQSLGSLRRVVDRLLTTAVELKVFNTICDATAKRQEAAERLADKVDVMLVVGGKNSANTTRLAQLCSAINPETHHIETAAEIDPAWFSEGATVGVTAGASTPDWILREVVEAVRRT